MFHSSNENGFENVLPGIKIKTLTFGELTLFTEFRMEKGSLLPNHSHSNEQTGYLIKGKVKLKIGNEQYNVKPGDCWSIGKDIEHNAEILEDSVAIEVFSPVREDYKKYFKD